MAKERLDGTLCCIDTQLIREQLKSGNTESKIIYIYDALCEKGYDPISQMIGYILTEDPTYITNHKHARIIAQGIDRDTFLRTLLEHFTKTKKDEEKTKETRKTDENI